MVQSTFANTVFLEAAVEYTSTFPAEFQRLLTTIRQIDGKIEVTKRDVEQKVLRALQQPPHGRDAASTMFARMMEDIEADHALLLAWADERVQLAQTASDLVEHYLERVDGDVAMFDEEIRSTEVFMDEFEDLGAFTPREAPLSSRGRSTPAPVEMPALPPAPSGGRSSSQANDASMPRSNSRSAQPAQGHADYRTDVPEFKVSRLSKLNTVVNYGPPIERAEGEPFIPSHGVFINPPPSDLKQVSAQLQTRGKFLDVQDVGGHLRGRLAELYWPDDGYWYLIEIQDVNSAAMTAHIMYMTGDTEELQLGDIIRDKHMHLIVR